MLLQYDYNAFTIKQGSGLGHMTIYNDDTSDPSNLDLAILYLFSSTIYQGHNDLGSCLIVNRFKNDLEFFC